MTNNERIEIILKETLRFLPAKIRAEFTRLDQPYLLEKPRKNLHILKMAIYPKVASGFWRWEKCSYEIGIGTYGDYTALGGVGFYCFSKQKVCGGNRFTNRVQKIMEKVQRLRPTEFQSTHVNSICLNRFYSAEKFSHFPLQVAGYDLAWLIEHSYPLFQQILADPNA